MKRVIQARIYEGLDGYYVGEYLDLPVVTQGRTLDEVAANLKEALALHLEGEDLSEMGFEDSPAVLVSFEIDAVIHARLVNVQSCCIYGRGLSRNLAGSIW
jgi:predicted RNase H-like HicB family nuclease